MKTTKAVGYSPEELQEFKLIIEKKIAQAKETIAILKEEMNDFTEKGGNEKSSCLEDGTESSMRENWVQMIGRQEKFVRDLELALFRIENGTYGICRVTGKLISKERLKAVPHATLSIEAKNKLED